MIDQIRPSQLSAWLETARPHGAPVVLDVREPAELRMASVKADGFDLVAIPMSLVPLRLNELDPDQPIACLCHHGARSMQVAMFLNSRGFTKVVNLAGGIHAWSNELDPTVPTY
jgi:rhodanese-related sulfurtransferase